jgi:hypothetical protein
MAKIVFSTEYKKSHVLYIFQIIVSVDIRQNVALCKID